jgi:hypothetical protein
MVVMWVWYFWNKKAKPKFAISSCKPLFSKMLFALMFDEWFMVEQFDENQINYEPLKDKY